MTINELKALLRHQFETAMEDLDLDLVQIGEVVHQVLVGMTEAEERRVWEAEARVEGVIG